MRGFRFHIQSAFFFTLLWTCAHADGAPERATDDGRFNTTCRPWAVDQTQRLCSVSPYRLISTPERYHGKLIQIIGYLFYEDGSLYLYPNKDDFYNLIKNESIELSVRTVSFDLQKDIRKGRNCVVVVGRFDAEYEGTQGGRLGRIVVDHVLEQARIGPEKVPSSTMDRKK